MVDGVVCCDRGVSDTPACPVSRDPADLRACAVHLARLGAAAVRTRRAAVIETSDGQAPAVRTKSSPTDPVTVVDTETEQLIRGELARLRPADAVLGEEGGGQVAFSGDRVVWIVDPIDGTVNFVYGIPAYGVSVAAACGGVVVAGAVADVPAQTTYHAALGQGAVVADSSGRERRLLCNTVSSVEKALVATGFGYTASRRVRQGAMVAELLPRVRDIRRIGAASLDLCLVASGRVDAHYEHGLEPWDWAAGGLIAKEAGAVVVGPAPETPGKAGELVVACAPGIEVGLWQLFEQLGITDPIPLV